MAGFSERFCLPMLINLRIHLNTSQNVPPILLLNSLSRRSGYHFEISTLI